MGQSIPRKLPCGWYVICLNSWLSDWFVRKKRNGSAWELVTRTRVTTNPLQDDARASRLLECASYITKLVREPKMCQFCLISWHSRLFDRQERLLERPHPLTSKMDLTQVC